MNRRVDFFWLGAGGLLTLYGTNEILAWRASHVRLWLGGNFSPAGGAIAVACGLLVIVALGLPRRLHPDDAKALAAEQEGPAATPEAPAPPAEDDLAS